MLNSLPLLGLLPWGAQCQQQLERQQQRRGGCLEIHVIGDTVSGAAVVATADRTTFSTSATAAYTAANLSAARSGPSGVSDGAIYGYVAGGYNSVTNLTVTTADRITFSSGATAAYTGAALSAARFLGHAFSDGAV